MANMAHVIDLVPALASPLIVVPPPAATLPHSKRCLILQVQSCASLPLYVLLYTCHILCVIFSVRPIQHFYHTHPAPAKAP